MRSFSRLAVFVCCYLALAFASVEGQAHAADYRIGAPAPWVVPIEPAMTARLPGGSSGGREYLLSDLQTRIETNNMVSFVHFATRAVDSAGVDDSARFSISFDPLYQSVTLHRIELRRGAARISKMASATIRVLQRETELETRIFDGRKSINVEIDDVRVGDVVDYAYSINGTNPVYANKYAGGAYLEWNSPVDRVFMRLLVPLGRELTFDHAKSGAAPVVTEAGGYRDYRWDRTSVAGLRVEKDAPAGYDPYAQVAWTEYPDWRAVARWALPLYQRSAPSPELKREIDAIAAASASPAERMLAALRLVQRDIRYLSVGAGASSHAPSAASLVFRRRFGDCKDKAVLLLTMLDALGIRAEPALVNSATLRREDVVLASPHVFNHVLVRATIDGKPYWIDPTRSEQHGDLAHLFQPDYGLALPITPDTVALTPMAPPRPAARRIVSTFDASEGIDKPVGLIVTTTLQGGSAEHMRSLLVSKGVANMQADYLNYYARKYPSIKSAGTMRVHDEKASNTITLTETYTIGKYWSEPDDNGRQSAFTYSPEVGALLNVPDALNRTAPLPLKFPEELEEVTVVKLFDAWTVEPRVTVVKDDAFEFTHRVARSANARTVTVTDHYRALADRVTPQHVRLYAANIRKASDETGLSLYWTRDQPQAINYPLAYTRLALIVILLAAIVFMGRQYKKSPAAHKALDHQLLSWGMVAAVVLILFLFGLRTFEALVITLCIGLTVLFVIATVLGGAAPAAHWLHFYQNGRRVHMVRDMLIGSSLTMLLLPYVMQR